MPDKYQAVWVSHSSISDFLTCPRSYYLKNVYKDPDTNKKVKLISPPLALGSTVHTVLESLSTLPSDGRFSQPLLNKYAKEWEKYEGKKGGFESKTEEQSYKERGEVMLKKVIDNPGPLSRLAVKINMDLPYYWLSEDDEIILCGKIDWLEYLEDEDAVNIIDFKTSKKKEEGESLQLPIYHLLVHNCQKRDVKGASYWYLELEDKPDDVDLPDLEQSYKDVLLVAKKIKVARQLEKFDCPNGEDGCRACKPMEKIIAGEAEYVGKDEYGMGVYFLPREDVEEDREGVLL